MRDESKIHYMEQKAHGINLSSETTDREIEEFQVGPGINMGQIRSHVLQALYPRNVSYSRTDRNLM